MTGWRPFAAGYAWIADHREPSGVNRAGRAPGVSRRGYCVRAGEGWRYLAAILDPANRRLAGRSRSGRIDAERACQALRSVCRQRKPAPTSDAGLIRVSTTSSRATSVTPSLPFEAMETADGRRAGVRPARRARRPAPLGSPPAHRP
ncbi:Putative transposase [Burkholderia glumae BGR1]|uniref:Putative transposase n=1 Tax=Burkholderia glumae TaxID=337 RepID=Q4VSJ6_BURGL|nr:putative transposase [Burkholderia glumae BGR1]ACR31070.1 Putative transposase [Burkholderia glumae BGR1]